jgi:hypothetical protein
MSEELAKVTKQLKEERDKKPQSSDQDDKMHEMLVNM